MFPTTPTETIGALRALSTNPHLTHDELIQLRLLTHEIALMKHDVQVKTREEQQLSEELDKLTKAAADFCLELFDTISHRARAARNHDTGE